MNTFAVLKLNEIQKSRPIGGQSMTVRFPLELNEIQKARSIGRLSMTIRSSWLLFQRNTKGKQMRLGAQTSNGALA